MGKWKYESEWTNEVSMVLTGAAFYHKVQHKSFIDSSAKILLLTKSCHVPVLPLCCPSEINRVYIHL